MWSIQRFVLILCSTLFAACSGQSLSRPLDHMMHHFTPIKVPFVDTSILPVNDDLWMCGGEMISETLAFLDVGGSCLEKMPEYNLCCAVHDSCYDNMIGGRTNCDDEFCRCTLAALEGPVGKEPECEHLKSDKDTTFYCNIVRKIGGSFYGKGKSRQQFQEHHPALNQTANQEYQKIYTSCPGFLKPATVCASNHMVCTVKYLPENRYKQNYTDCREQLIECVTHAAEFLMKDNEECLKQVEAVVEAIKNDAKLSGLPEELHWIEPTTPEVTSTTTEDAETTTENSESSTATTSGASSELPSDAFTSSSESFNSTTIHEKSPSSSKKSSDDDDFPMVVVTAQQ